MGIPAQVRKQGEEAEKLAQEHLKKKPAEADASAGKPAPAEKPKAEPGNWEKRFKGLKKTHDITVSGLRKDLRDLQLKFDALQKAPDSAQAAAPSQVDIMSVLTEQEKKEYSPEFLDMVSRLIARVSGTGGGESALESRISNLEVSSTETKEDTFWNAINDALPGWRKLQATEDMQAWLLEYDDLLGMVRSEAVAQAQSILDANRVIAIFKSYSAPAAVDILDDDEAQLLAPDEGGGDGGLPLATDDKIWTVPEIQEFYKKLALGKFKGKDGRERAKQIELSIEKAREEDRIRK